MKTTAPKYLVFTPSGQTLATDNIEQYLAWLTEHGPEAIGAFATDLQAFAGLPEVTS